MISEILDKGGDPNLTDKQGWSALYWVAGRDHHEQQSKAVIVLLITNGADPNFQNASGLSSLHQSARAGRSVITSILLGLGAFMNLQDHAGCTALYLSAWHKRIACVRVLLKAGASSSIREYKNGWNPLIAATYGGHVEVMEVLLNEGKDLIINTQDFTGKTSLYWAAQKGHKKGTI